MIEQPASQEKSENLGALFATLGEHKKIVDQRVESKGIVRDPGLEDFIHFASAA